ncbi:MAG: hypothetical protein WBG10_14580 [Pseudolabrys sp.]
MRKVLMITLGLASLGALASVQPAFAEKKTICQTRTPWDGLSSQCNTGAARDKNNCKITYPVAGLAFKKECYTVDVGPTPTVWKGNSANATQTYSLSRTHQK